MSKKIKMKKIAAFMLALAIVSSPMVQADLPQLIPEVSVSADMGTLQEDGTVIGSNTYITWSYDTLTKKLSISSKTNGIKLYSYMLPSSITYKDDSSNTINVSKSDIAEFSVDSNITAIYNSTFKGLDNLKSIEFKYTDITDEEGNKTGVSGVKSIENWAFKDCTSLQTINLNNVTTIESEAFSGCTSLNDIGSLASAIIIRHDAFSACTALTGKIELSKVATLEYEAFASTKITEVDFTGNIDLEEIPYGAFYKCEELTKVTLSSSITKIKGETNKRGAFEGCSNLKEITTEGSANTASAAIDLSKLTEIGEAAFRDTFTLPANSSNPSLTADLSKATVVGSYAFQDCGNLSRVNFGNDTLSDIGYAAFRCTGLTRVKIPGKVSTIYGNAFDNCPLLEKIDVDTNNTFYFDDEGVLFGKDSPTNGIYKLIKYPDNKKDGNDVQKEYIIPKTVQDNNGNNCTITIIDSRAFANSKLETVKFADDSEVKEIYSGAFANCQSLVGTIKIPDSVTKIGSQAFFDSPNITAVNFGTSPTASKLESIGDYAFSVNDYKEDFSEADYPNLTGKLVIPNSVTSIGNDAFAYCNKLTEFDLGKDSSTEMTIGNRAFKCTGLTGSIQIPDRVTSIGNEAFRGSLGITGVQFGTSPSKSKLKTIGYWAFSVDTYDTDTSYDWGTDNVPLPGLDGSIVIPDSVTSIGSYAFAYCKSLDSVSFGSGLTTISEHAFYHCTDLAGNINIPGNVAKIGDSAFSGCSSLNNLAFEPNEDSEAIITIGELAFANCTELAEEDNSEIIFPKRVTSIEDNAFYQCSGIKSIAFEDGSKLTSLGVGAFSGCTGLDESITIPAGVTIIKNSTFWGCKNLPSVTLPANLKTIDDSAFHGCSSLQSLNVPAAVETIGNFAFAYNTALSNINLDGATDGTSQLTTIGAYAFVNCTLVGKIIIPSSVTTIGGRIPNGSVGTTWTTNAFSRWTNAQHIIVNKLKDECSDDMQKGLKDDNIANVHYAQPIKIDEETKNGWTYANTPVSNFVGRKLYGMATTCTLTPDSDKGYGCPNEIAVKAKDTRGVETLLTKGTDYTYSIVDGKGILTINNDTQEDGTTKFADMEIIVSAVAKLPLYQFTEWEDSRFLSSYNYHEDYGTAAATVIDIPADIENGLTTSFTHIDAGAFDSVKSTLKTIRIPEGMHWQCFTGNVFNEKFTELEKIIFDVFKDEIKYFPSNWCQNIDDEKIFGAQHVTFDLNNIESINDRNIEDGEINVDSNNVKIYYDKDSKITLKAKSGYTLSSSITVTCGNTTLESGEDKDYTFNSSTGELVINSDKVLDTVKVSASAYKRNTSVSTPDAMLLVAPKAVANLTYNGKAQKLITQGTVHGGTLMYSINGGDWQDTLPTATNAGEYTIEYYVKGNAGYNDTDVETLTVSIAKAIPTLDEPVADGEYTYGITLKDVALSGDWQWLTPTQKPVVNNSGYKAYLEVDDKNYDYSNISGYYSSSSRVVRTVDVTVNKAVPEVSVTAESKQYLAGGVFTTENIVTSSNTAGEITFADVILKAGINTISWTFVPENENFAEVTGTIQVSADVTVKSTLSNLTLSGESTASTAEAYTATLKSDTGYSLPEEITVTMGGKTLASGTGYTYDSTTGEIIISKVTGDISISAVAVKNVYDYTVNFELTNITTNGSETANSEEAYTTTLKADTGYSLPAKIAVTMGGKTLVARTGYTYDSTTGEIIISKVTGDISISATAVKDVYDYTVNFELANITTTGSETANSEEAYTATLKADTGYSLPAEITVSMGGKTLVAGTGYTYDSETGEVVITKVTGDITISATAVKNVYDYKVNFELANITTTGDETANSEESYTATLKADTGYSLPSKITVTMGGKTLASGTDYTYDNTTGEVIISVVTGDISISAVAVKEVIDYNVNIDDIENITVTGDKTANSEEEYKITLTPDTGYSLPEEITVTMGGKELIPGTDYTYDNTTGEVVITKVTGDISISAVAVKDVYDYIVNIGDIENITVIGKNTAVSDEEYTATLKADTGYSLPEKITVVMGGKTLVSGTDYTYDSTTGEIIISKVTGDISISAVAVKEVIDYNVNIDDIENITVTGNDTANSEEEYKITLTPDTGYTLPEDITVTMGGKELVAGEDYTYDSTTGEIVIAKVTGDISISAVAVEDVYDYIVNIGDIENITVIGKNTAASDEEYTATLKPDTGYLLPEEITVTMGGKELVAGTDYTYDSTTGEVVIPEVTGDISISAVAVKEVIDYNVNIDDIENITVTGDNTANSEEEYKITLTPDTGYTLPEDITVTMDGKELVAGTDYTYDSTTGKVVISAVTGDITISAVAVKNEDGFLLGDANVDKKVSAIDIVHLKNHLLEIKTLEGQGFTNADMNQDGKLAVVDMVLLKKYILGL